MLPSKEMRAVVTITLVALSSSAVSFKCGSLLDRFLNRHEMEATLRV